jgi:tetratricopeptide (TPR) repeat protein
MPEGPLHAAIVDAGNLRTVQRVLLSGAEGVGRTPLLASVPGVVAHLSQGELLGQTLRALLGAVTDEAATLQALARSPALEGLEPERAAVAVELLGSLLGIRRPDGRTAKFDEDGLREGASLELARWVVERAQAGTFVLAFDDAHLLDDDGAAFLDGLAQREESVPLVLVVSYDSAPERFSAAFRARRERWLVDPRWSSVELVLPPPSQVAAGLTRLGATEEQAVAITQHAQGNPALAAGLWAAVKAGAPLTTLPTTLDGLRRFVVSSLGPDVLTACATMATLGEVVPLAALEAVQPTLRPALDTAQRAGVLRFERVGGFEVARFIDQRLTQSLLPELSELQRQQVRTLAGRWATQALDTALPATFVQTAFVLVPLAEAVLDAPTASLWNEACATASGGRAESAARLERALKTASGVRRLVLLRRLAEVKLFHGQPAQALRVLSLATRADGATVASAATAAVLAAQHRGVLDRWETLTYDEAQAALELVRAESWSHLSKKEETERAFQELERRLRRLKGAAVPHLWLRWAKAWSWFLCEVLGRTGDALKACALVRTQVDPAVLANDDDALAFVRAEEVATTSAGELSRARVLTDEHLALAERAGSLRDAALAWNARALVRYGEGELGDARHAFERALELARATGWLRREAVALHNLALVLTELGEFDAAAASEATYARLSTHMGNHVGAVEAPMVLATIELARGHFAQAEQLLVQARRVCEANGWDMLIAQSRALLGRCRLLRSRVAGDALETAQARNDLAACIDALEERSLAWTEELDPGEVFGLYAIALKWSGQPTQGAEALARARARLPDENVVSGHQLSVAEAVLQGQPVEPSLAWFDQHGFARRAALWRDLAVSFGDRRSKLA